MNKKVILTSLSGFQYGYNTSIIAAAILFLSVDFSLTAFEQGFAASAIMLGAALSCLFSAPLSNSIGRKGTLFLGACLFFIGICLSSMAPVYALFLGGRFIVGLASGIAILVPPIYLIEISPPHQRGSAANANQVGMGIGSLLAYGLGYALSFSENWRAMLAVGLLPAFCQLISLFSIPESPAMGECAPAKGSSHWKELLGTSYRPRLLLGLSLCACQSLIGAPAVFYFTPTLLEQGGFQTPSSALLVTLLIGCAYFIGILISFWTVDHWGRRWLVLVSSMGMSISLWLLALFSSLHLSFLNEAMWIGLLIFIIAYAVGLGPVPPLVVGEITPTRLRAHAMTLTGFVGMAMNYLVTLTCPLLLEKISLSGTFFLYGFFGILGFSFFLWRLPETKGKNPGEINY
jgi:SP family galactose:H+ symporter-like MFS transporter